MVSFLVSLAPGRAALRRAVMGGMTGERMDLVAFLLMAREERDSKVGQAPWWRLWAVHVSSDGDSWGDTYVLLLPSASLMTTSS